MDVQELRDKIAYVPGDSKINIVSTGSNPEINYEIDEIIFDTVDQLFINISGI